MGLLQIALGIRFLFISYETNLSRGVAGSRRRWPCEERALSPPARPVHTKRLGLTTQTVYGYLRTPPTSPLIWVRGNPREVPASWQTSLCQPAHQNHKMVPPLSAHQAKRHTMRGTAASLPPSISPSHSSQSSSCNTPIQSPHKAAPKRSSAHIYAGDRKGVYTSQDSTTEFYEQIHNFPTTGNPSAIPPWKRCWCNCGDPCTGISWTVFHKWSLI